MRLCIKNSHKVVLIAAPPRNFPKQVNRLNGSRTTLLPSKTSRSLYNANEARSSNDTRGLLFEGQEKDEWSDDKRVSFPRPFSSLQLRPYFVWSDSLRFSEEKWEKDKEMRSGSPQSWTAHSLWFAVTPVPCFQTHYGVHQLTDKWRGSWKMKWERRQVDKRLLTRIKIKKLHMMGWVPRQMPSVACFVPYSRAFTSRLFPSLCTGLY